MTALYLLSLPLMIGWFGEEAVDLLTLPIAAVAGIFGLRLGLAFVPVGVALTMGLGTWLALPTGEIVGVPHLVVFLAVAQGHGKLHDLLVESRLRTGRLERSETILRGVLENAPLVIWAVDAQGRFTLREGRALAALGHAPGDHIGRDARDMYREQYPEAAADLGANLERALAGEDFRAVVRLRGRAMDVGYQTVRDGRGRITGVVCAGVDVTERENAESGVQRAQARLEAILASALDAIITIDQRGQIILFNRAAQEMFDYAEGDVIGTSIERLIPEAARSLHRRHLAAYVDGGIGQHNLHLARPLSARRADGSVFDAEISLSRVDANGEVLATVIIRDVSEKKRLDAQLEHLALHDQLTDLPNRTLFSDRVDQAVAALQRDATPFALIVLDLDQFREANDALGQHAGDAILIGVVQRLRALVRDTDTLARLGGDDFGILLRGANERGAIDVAARVLDALRRPVVAGGHPVDVTASLGIALAPVHGSDRATLMRRADVAMFQAKRDRDRYVIYSAEGEEPTADGLTLVSELRAAIDQRQITLAYQPEVDLRDGRLLRFEVLARWRRANGDVMPPEQFIALAERSGLIGALTRCVLEKAVTQVAAWGTGGARVAIAVNVSGRDLADDSLPGMVRDLLERHAVRPEQLTLEITEGVLVTGVERVIPRLQILRDLGVTLAIDDFGTGYSSLSYLSRLPVGEVKIDRSFVHRMTMDPGAMVVVRAAISLAHDLGLKVVAEGVETAHDLELLKSLHCDAAQGYIVARPLDPEEADAWVRRPKRVTSTAARERPQLSVTART